jgi:hypothetical protein
MKRGIAALATFGLFSGPLLAQTCLDYTAPSDLTLLETRTLPASGNRMVHTDDALWVGVDSALVRLPILAPGVLGTEQLVPIAPYAEPYLAADGDLLVGADTIGGEAYLFTVNATAPYDVRPPIDLGPGSAKGLDVDGATALVAHSVSPYYNAFTMVDFSSPESPSVVGTISGFNRYSEIVIQEPWAFVGSLYGTVTHLLSLDPSIGPVDEGAVDVGRPIAWYGDNLYTSTGIWNVVNVHLPVHLAVLPGGCLPDDRLLTGVTVVDGNLFTIGGSGIWGWIWDGSEDIERSGLWPWPSRSLSSLVGADGHLYALVDDQLKVYEVAGTDGPHPAEARWPVLGYYDSYSDGWDVDSDGTEISFLSIGGGYGFARAPAGYSYFVAGMTTTPGSCSLGSFTPVLRSIGQDIGRVDFTSDRVVGVDGAALTVQDRANPHPLTGFPFWLVGATDVQVVGYRAYISSDNGWLDTFDVTDPDNPVRVDQTAAPGAVNQLRVSGSAAYLASDDGGVVAYDLSDPDAPALSFSESPGTERDYLQLDGDLLAAVDESTGRVYTYDLADPLAPVPLGSTGIGSGARDVVVKDEAAYVNCGDHFAVVDLRTPEAPEVVARVTTILPIRGLATDGSYLYVLQGHNLLLYPMQCALTLPTSAPPTEPGGPFLTHPNPFRTQTSIALDVPRAGRVMIDIVDVTGRNVRSWAETVGEPGNRTFLWNGRDREGRPVAAGIYFVKLSGTVQATRKVVRIR